MSIEERNRYLDAYYDNEANANKQMSFANAFAAIFLTVIWILYLTGAFPTQSSTSLLINILFPLGIAVLLTPAAYALWAPRFLKKPRYKYFVVFSFILVVAAMNIILPKHSRIAWALCIIMTNHYYNPKLGTTSFAAVMVLMVGCIYASMFLGEYDPGTLGKGIIVGSEIVYPDGVQARYEMLKDLIAAGDNRYLKVLVNTAIPRGAVLALIFIVSHSLNHRTKKLLIDEILINSEQEKTKTELEVAKEIQLATLPVEFTVGKGIEIQAELKAAKSVGGDFYDYFTLDDNHVAIVIGDVSGKGIPAAMFMMKTITCFKNYMSPHKSPAEILRQVNAAIYQGNQSSMFVTCFLAIVDTKTGEVRFANAGHNKPLVGHDKAYHYLDCRSGFILGALEEAVVFDEQTKLEKGDSITLYTDGITEAMNEERQLYGEERLLALFNRKEYTCLLEMHHELKEDVARFAGEEEQSDDMTYITLRYQGDDYVYEEKQMPATQDNVLVALGLLKAFAAKNDFDEGFTNNLAVVGDELISNIVKYGYPNDKGEMYLRALYNRDRKEFVLTIVDSGIPFNPFEAEGKPVEGDVKDIHEGGLGILIVKNLMSEYAYDRINGKNITVIKKRF